MILSTEFKDKSGNSLLIEPSCSSGKLINLCFGEGRSVYQADVHDVKEIIEILQPLIEGIKNKADFRKKTHVILRNASKGG